MRWLLMVPTAWLFIATCVAQEQEARLVFPEIGFSIAPLDIPTDLPIQTALSMYLPTSGDFAPNVNVQVQAFEGTFSDYIALSEQQFRQAGLTAHVQETTDTSATFEYSGNFQGMALHWYARALAAKGKAYLVTATTPESDWASQAAQLKACVDSFALE